MRFVWPLSGTTTPDPMNTSFGPRINKGRWDFHDGIDLPASVGTTIHAVRPGTVKFAGAGDTDGFSSRHVVIEHVGPAHPPVFSVYLHLDSIEATIVPGACVVRGQRIGTVGRDDATYPHLHFEIRRGTHHESDSVHPLHYLPYRNTRNFSAPVLDRFNRLGSRMAARLLFHANDRREGDLKRVEVDLLRGFAVLARRIVDFDDKDTINEGNGDDLLFVKDIGVEGYQQSQMDDPERTRGDLRYGILVRNIPDACDRLVARVIDVGGKRARSVAIPVPDQAAVDESLTFDDALMPPAGWIRVTSTSGTGTSVGRISGTGPAGSPAMRCTDNSTTETRTQRAAIEYELTSKRFQWIASGRFKLKEARLGPGQSVYLLSFHGDECVSVAARVQKVGSRLRPGLVAENHSPRPKGTAATAEIRTDRWAVWKLRISRIGTREATAVLCVDGVEQDRLTWDSTTNEPRRLRAGIGLSSKGIRATVLANDVTVTELD
jgi:hypothetical protein